MKTVDLKNHIKESKTGQDRFLAFVYSHMLTRALLKPFTQKWFSDLGGKVLSSAFSTVFIYPFAFLNHIDLSECAEEKYTCFNDFFRRHLKEGARKIDEDEEVIISPADGRVQAFRLSKKSRFKVKNTVYSVKSLTGSKTLAKKYEEGTVVIIRLSVDNYHRYHYLGDGKVIKSHAIPGEYHTVNPIANDHVPVYKTNSRVVSLLRTEKFGDIVQVEVGALLVGKIVNHKVKHFTKGQERGYFEFGGSTIVLLFDKDHVAVEKKYIENTEKGMETEIRMGMKLAKSVHHYFSKKLFGLS